LPKYYVYHEKNASDSNLKILKAVVEKNIENAEVMTLSEDILMKENDFGVAIIFLEGRFEEELENKINQ